MADESVTTDALPVQTGLANSDTVVCNYTAANGQVNTVIVAVGTLFNNSAISSLRVPTSSPPANSTANGSVGTVVWDSGFVYVCVANNTWKRATLASF